MRLCDMDATLGDRLHVHCVNSIDISILLEQCIGHSADNGWAKFVRGHIGTEYEPFAGYAGCGIGHSTSFDCPVDHRCSVFVHSFGPKIPQHSDNIAIQLCDAAASGHVAIATAHFEAFPRICSHHAFSIVKNRFVELII